MGCRILHSNADDMAVLYCSTSDWAFGPVFYADDNHDADERAEAFQRWLKIDPRKFTERELETKYCEWRAQEVAQFNEEERIAADGGR